MRRGGGAKRDRGTREQVAKDADTDEDLSLEGKMEGNEAAQKGAGKDGDHDGLESKLGENVSERDTAVSTLASAAHADVEVEATGALIFNPVLASIQGETEVKVGAEGENGGNDEGSEGAEMEAAGEDSHAESDKEAKPKRGRPRKAESELKRPRGRPKGSGASSAGVGEGEGGEKGEGGAGGGPEEGEGVPKRKRGRPKKLPRFSPDFPVEGGGMGDATGKEEAPTTSAGKEAVPTNPASTGRKRGRPKKIRDSNDAADSTDGGVVQEVVKRPRGRPRKNPIGTPTQTGNGTVKKRKKNRESADSPVDGKALASESEEEEDEAEEAQATVEGEDGGDVAHEADVAVPHGGKSAFVKNEGGSEEGVQKGVRSARKGHGAVLLMALSKAKRGKKAEKERTGMRWDHEVGHFPERIPMPDGKSGLVIEECVVCAESAAKRVAEKKEQRTTGSVEITGSETAGPSPMKSDEERLRILHSVEDKVHSTAFRCDSCHVPLCVGENRKCFRTFHTDPSICTEVKVPQ
eukprot:TRINITY_DN3904_c0_g1_i1.p1 TRINITY_DN3904_c0_g1~~TRINITY_DN3904_c0_g1_i1.p1  ORF type:complete len:521 (+),score=131.80 TRINITY_DN3904_c0_g1_i1:285-1847(+)